MKGNNIVFSLIALLLGTGLAGAATLNVGQGQAYTTIQSALDAAVAGDVISVGEGTYLENVYVRTGGVLIIGKDKEKTIIDGQKTGSVIRIEADDVTVSGFTIQNNGGSGKEDAGITIYSASNNLIANSIIANNTAGVAIYSSSNGNVISGNYIKSNARRGIFMYSSLDNKIYNNNIQGNPIGIYADSARSSSIYSNNFIDNRDQAFDNSGANAWDDGASGNYWSNHKGTGGYSILGGAKVMDNYPRASAVTIKDVPITMPAENPDEQKNPGEAGKSSPGFTVILVMASMIMSLILRYRKKE